MKYVAKCNFKDGTLDEAGVVKNFCLGEEYNGANVESLLSQGLIAKADVESQPSEPAPQVIPETQVDEVLGSVAEEYKPKRKGKKKGE